VRFLQRAFSTASLTGSDWLLCPTVASGVLWLRELNKVAPELASNHRGIPRRDDPPRRSSTGTGFTVFFFLGALFDPIHPAALGNFFVPMMIGARDLAFSRPNVLKPHECGRA
jgi:hypothetical protein